MKYLAFVAVALLLLPLATALDFETEKLNYVEGDLVKVEIFPKNTFVDVSYNGQTIKTKDYAEFQSVLYENKITVKHNDKEVNHIINVQDKETKKLFKDLLSFCFVGFILYSAAKKYYIKLNAI